MRAVAWAFIRSARSRASSASARRNRATASVVFTAASPQSPTQVRTFRASAVTLSVPHLFHAAQAIAAVGGWPRNRHRRRRGRRGRNAYGASVCPVGTAPLRLGRRDERQLRLPSAAGERILRVFADKRVHGAEDGLPLGNGPAPAAF
jgi:hypothetical protein